MKFLSRLAVVVMAGACFSVTASVDTNNNQSSGINPVTASVLLKAQKVMTGILSSMSVASASAKPDISGDMKVALPTNEAALPPLPQQAMPGEPTGGSAQSPVTPSYRAPQPQTIMQQPAPASAAASAKLMPVGRVIWVKGTIVADHDGQAERGLIKQSILFVGDKLVTGKKTEAEIAFTDTTLMTLGENTIFVIKDYAYHPDSKEGKSVGRFVMDLVAGAFRTITGLIPKGDPSDYKVETPVATIGVRGTDYMALVTKNLQKNAATLTMEQLKGVPTATFAGNKTVTLNDTDRYVTVESDGSFVLSAKRPAILGAPLPIIPATVKPITLKEIENTFAAPGSNGWCIIQNTSGGASSGGSGSSGGGGGH
jgi:uncharacterized membrane protein YgcG